MRKIFIIVLFLCGLSGALDVSAQGRSQEILSQLAARIAAMGDYHAGFEVEAEGNHVKGTYAVSGDKYYMKTDDYEVIGDGKARYEINHYDEEVLIDRSNPADRNILSNPTRAFEFAEDIFTDSYKGEETVNGEVRDVVELIPTDTKTPLRRITLKVNRKTGLPAELRYLSDGLSEDVVVRINMIVKGPSSNATFTFDRTEYKDYDIVDFR